MMNTTRTAVVAIAVILLGLCAGSAFATSDGSATDHAGVGNKTTVAQPCPVAGECETAARIAPRMNRSRQAVAQCAGASECSDIPAPMLSTVAPRMGRSRYAMAPQCPGASQCAEIPGPLVSTGAPRMSRSR